MRFPIKIRGWSRSPLFSHLVIGAVLLCVVLAVGFFLNSNKVSAAQSSVQVTCLDFESGQPVVRDLAGFTGDSDSYGGVTCLSTEDLVIRPGAPSNTLHTLTASCSTTNAIFEEKTNVFDGGEEMRYVAFRCDPPGETLTLTHQPAPGTHESHSLGSEYLYDPDGTLGCPPECGIDHPPEEPTPPTGSTAICIAYYDSSSDVDACIAEINSGNPPNLFQDALRRWCALEAESANVNDRPAVISACMNRELTAAGFETESEGEDAENQQSCEEASGVEVSWILCPVMRMLDDGVNFLDQKVNELLQVRSEYYTNEDLKSAWTRLRNIAYIILIPIMLVMVIGTALGFSAIDAYTVKRALPRLIAAVLFISVSWYITSFMIIFTNDIGRGMQGLITSSVPGASNLTLADLFTPDQGDSNKVVGFALVGLVALLATTSIGILISYFFVAALFLFVTFLILAFRQFLIITLALVAPLAILSWIFPGNEKIWKLWWGSFSKLLLMFPLIALLLGTGKAFAAIVNTPGSTGFIESTLKLAAYILPYVFIPFTFKWAGGVFATIAGMAQDRERGLLDRQKKYRGEKRAQNWSEFKTGDKPWRGKAFNNLGMRVGAGWKGRFGVGKRGSASMDLRRRMQAAERQKDPLMNQLQFDDDGVLASSLGSTAGESKKALEAYRQRLRDSGHVKEAEKWTDKRIDQAVATASIAGFSRSNQAASFDMMARNKSFSLVGGPAGMETMIDAANRLSGGNKQMADNIMGSFEFNSRQAGRFDLGMHDYSGGKADMEGAWGKAGLYQHATGTSASLQSFANHYINQFRNGDVNERKQAAIALTEMQSMLPSATAANKDIINKTMQAIGVDFTTRQPVAEQIAVRSGGTASDPSIPATPVITADEITGNARVYDRETGFRDAVGRE